MVNKKKIRINDKHRALLTETLPLEKLFPFTNMSFHSTVNKSRGSFPALLKALLEIKGFTIPYDYEALSKPGSSRKLSIIHPAKQIEIADFYEKNKDYIIYLCSRSPLSLRRPASNYKYYYCEMAAQQDENLLINGDEVEVAAGPFEQEAGTYKSYFVYKPYGYLYKFYDSWKFLHIEKNFRYLEKLDISKCFYNIYTHTIEWSVKSREHSKENLRANTSFEKTFDKLMMESNYNETNGIVVGPEVSRIFAEIILQKVDDNILKNLSGQSVRSPEDYSILRYVDDYFVFSNDFKVRDRVIDVIKHELSLIKLYINERKSVSFDKPFMTKESNAKIETSIAIDRFFEGITKDEKYNTKTRPRMATNYLVQELKKCASSNDIPFSSISRYTLQVLIKRSLILLKKSIDENLSLSDITYYLINVIFVLYSYDSNYRTTNIICLFFLDLFESFRRKDKVLTAEMARVFFEQATNHIKYKVVRSENIGIEEWNLILVLSEVWQYEKIESDVLLSWLKNSKKYHSDEACYFTIIVGLYYSSDRGEYEHVRSHFVKIITEFLNNSFKKNSSHDVILILDLMACPWIATAQKLVWAKIICSKLSPTLKDSKKDENSRKFVGFASKRTWFMDWNAPNKLYAFLKKMEQQSPY